MRNIDFKTFLIAILLGWFTYSGLSLWHAEKLIEALSNVEYDCV